MWRFRPSAFFVPSRYVNASSSTLYQQYMSDNEKATKDGVTIPSRRTLLFEEEEEGICVSDASTSIFNTPPYNNNNNNNNKRVLRTCQWNVHYFASTIEVPDSCQLAMMIADKVIEMDADIIVLNEFGTMAPRFILSSNDTDDESSRSKLPVEYCRDRLELYGYSLHTANCFYPTVVATKLPVTSTKKFSLDVDRAVVAVQIELLLMGDDNDQVDDVHDDVMGDKNNNNNSEEKNDASDSPPPDDEKDPTATSNDDDNRHTTTLWVYGTHFEAGDDHNGTYRRLEVDRLLDVMQHQHHPTAIDFGGEHTTITTSKENASSSSPVVANNNNTDDPFIMLIGDFNQQRSQDYTAEEWEAICENKVRRDSPLDDGVSTALKDAGFSCVFDDQLVVGNDSAATTTRTIIRRNWPTNTPPPSSHWSGTLIDYTYFRGSGLHLTGVYVSPCNLSDHRMIVCDWMVELIAENNNNNNNNINEKANK